jgi:hypothetical protein
MPNTIKTKKVTHINTFFHVSKRFEIKAPKKHKPTNLFFLVCTSKAQNKKGESPKAHNENKFANTKK